MPANDRLDLIRLLKGQFLSFGNNNMTDVRSCCMVATLAPHNLGSSSGLEYYKKDLILIFFCFM